VRKRRTIGVDARADCRDHHSLKNVDHSALRCVCGVASAAGQVPVFLRNARRNTNNFSKSTASLLQYSFPDQLYGLRAWRNIVMLSHAAIVKFHPASKDEF
jgi:hypothetical protein